MAQVGEVVLAAAAVLTFVASSDPAARKHRQRRQRARHAFAEGRW
jgi:hypothetical protein